jgi:hypothetical protein
MATPVRFSSQSASSSNGKFLGSKVFHLAQRVGVSVEYAKKMSNAFGKVGPYFLCTFSEGKFYIHSLIATNGEGKAANLFDRILAKEDKSFIPINFSSFSYEVGEIWQDWRLGVEISKPMDDSMVDSLLKWGKKWMTKNLKTRFSKPLQR